MSSQAVEAQKEAEKAYMTTYSEFKDLAEAERDIISRLRAAERSVRQIKREERKLDSRRQELCQQAKQQETELKERFGLTDLDLLVLRKRTEPQKELPEWLRFE